MSQKEHSTLLLCCTSSYHILTQLQITDIQYINKKSIKLLNRKKHIGSITKAASTIAFSAANRFLEPWNLSLWALKNSRRMSMKDTIQNNKYTKTMKETFLVIVVIVLPSAGIDMLARRSAHTHLYRLQVSCWAWSRSVNIPWVACGLNCFAKYMCSEHLHDAFSLKES